MSGAAEAQDASSGAALPTPSQTVGPYLAIGLMPFEHTEVVAPGTPGALRIGGVLSDGGGEPIPDGVVEIWQADAGGRYGPDATPGWSGFGRSLTDAQGRFGFVTVKPGPTTVGETALAPHLDVLVFARGLLRSVRTRCYFPDEAEANAADPLLAALPDPTRRATLVAVDEGDHYRFDIRLQGEAETIFFGW